MAFVDRWALVEQKLMLEKPDIPDEKIIMCLQREYGVPITQLVFLPLGGDLSTAVYRAVAEDEMLYFCKLKRDLFDEISVELPRFLYDQGVNQMIPPLVTQAGALWATLDAFHLILYPFLVGTSGFEIELSERQWAEFGTTLRRIHSTRVPASLSSKIREESYSPEWRDKCRVILRRLDEEVFDDPITLKLVEFLLPKRQMILDLVGRAERFADALALRSIESVLCHSDIHPGNLFIDTQGAVFIVDWDYPMLAPRERDLMFIGGGQGFVSRTAKEEEALFYRYYGAIKIDPIALAYYRCERNVTDMVVECTRILSSTLGDQDRAQSLQILTWLFLPDSSIEIALRTEQTF